MDEHYFGILCLTFGKEIEYGIRKKEDRCHAADHDAYRNIPGGAGG